jgi:hypothetical protein
VAGSGQRLFEHVDASGLDLRLTGERRLENGSVILTYAPGWRSCNTRGGADSSANHPTAESQISNDLYQADRRDT